MAGGALEFDGSLVALNLEGGASEFDIDFPFKAENEGGFFTYRSVANGRCLEIANAALGDRAQLRLGTCTPGATHQQFGSVRTAGNGATVMVARHSGRCLDIPNGITNPSTHVQQYLCHGQPNQQAGWQAVHQGSCPRGFQFCHSIRFFLNPPACLEVSGIEARIEARTGIATSERCSSSRPGIEFDHEFVP
jgi:hypothetical protein